MSASTAASDRTQLRLDALVSPIVAEAGFDLEELVLTPMGRRSLLRVVIDRDDGLSLDHIAEISQAIAHALDEAEGEMGRAPYVLEVTSPGVDRPLTEARHWRRATGRLVEVCLHGAGASAGEQVPEGQPVRARVTACDDASVTLRLDDGAVLVVPLTELGAGKVQLEFNRPTGQS